MGISTPCAAASALRPRAPTRACWRWVRRPSTTPAALSLSAASGPTPDGRIKPDIVGVDCAASVSYELFTRRDNGEECWFPGHQPIIAPRGRHGRAGEAALPRFDPAAGRGLSEGQRRGAGSPRRSTTPGATASPSSPPPDTQPDLGGPVPGVPGPVGCQPGSIAADGISGHGFLGRRLPLRVCAPIVRPATTSSP